MALARYPHPDSPYSIILQGRFYAVEHAHHGIVLDEIDCFGDAEGHISQREDDDEQREADELAAEAEYATNHPELTLVPPAPVYRFERRHSTWDIYDADGDVGSFGWDAHDGCWWAVANTCRFATINALPTVFNGHLHHRLGHIDDVYAMFGVPLPTLLEMVGSSDVSAPVIVDASRSAEAA